MAGPRKAKRKERGPLAGARILVVEGRFYEDIADALLAGAKRVLEKAKVEWDVITVPGALEIPQAVMIGLDAAITQRKPFDGVVALGCVIRGETSHFDIVAGESARALMELSLARNIPIGNGILTVENKAQAHVRASPQEQDKGGAAAEAALALVRLKRALAQSRGRQ